MIEQMWREITEAVCKLHFNMCNARSVGLRFIGAPAKLEMIISVLESSTFDSNFILDGESTGN